MRSGKTFWCSLQACVLYSLVRFLKTEPHVSISSWLYSTRGIGCPLRRRGGGGKGYSFGDIYFVNTVFFSCLIIIIIHIKPT